MGACEGLLPSRESSSLREQVQAAERLLSAYEDGFGFPTWSIEVLKSGRLRDLMHETTVFFTTGENLDKVKEMASEREPVNMALDRMYDERILERHFGYRRGAYHKSTEAQLMPNIAIYCKTPMRSGDRGGPHQAVEEVEVNVINLVGFAFDDRDQPDYRYFYRGGTGREMPREKELELVERMSQMWHFAFNCARQRNLRRLYLADVGGGAFSTFLPNYSSLKERSLRPVKAQYPEIRVAKLPTIPDSVFTPDGRREVASSLLVNAWDPWSMVGNGNFRDFSLDGFFGRCTAMAVLCWPRTNPHLRYEAVPRISSL